MKKVTRIDPILPRSCWITSLCWSTPKPFYKPLINKWNFDVDVVILEAPVQDLTRSGIQNIHYRSPGGRESRSATLACFFVYWDESSLSQGPVPSCPKQDSTRFPSERITGIIRMSACMVYILGMYLIIPMECFWSTAERLFNPHKKQKIIKNNWGLGLGGGWGINGWLESNTASLCITNYTNHWWEKCKKSATEKDEGV